MKVVKTERTKGDILNIIVAMMAAVAIMGIWWYAPGIVEYTVPMLSGLDMPTRSLLGLFTIYMALMMLGILFMASYRDSSRWAKFVIVAGGIVLALFSPLGIPMGYPEPSFDVTVFFNQTYAIMIIVAIAMAGIILFIYRKINGRARNHDAGQKQDDSAKESGAESSKA